jgi:hypothetical protein
MNLDQQITDVMVRQSTRPVLRAVRVFRLNELDQVVADQNMTMRAALLFDVEMWEEVARFLLHTDRANGARRASAILRGLALRPTF